MYLLVVPARKDTWDLSMLPYNSKTWGTQLDITTHVGTSLAAIVKANNGKPPALLTFDYAGEHNLLLRAFVGLAAPSELESIPFFKNTRRKPMKAVFFARMHIWISIQ